MKLRHFVTLTKCQFLFYNETSETRAFSSRHENAHFYAQTCAEEICR